MAVAPPVRFTRYTRLAASVTPGLSVQNRGLVALWVTVVPAATTALVVVSVSVNVAGDTPVTVSLNVAVTLLPRGNPVVPASGNLAVTVGGVPVENFQVTVVSWAPAVSRIAVGLPVSVSVYSVSAARLAGGVRGHGFRALE